MKGSYNDLLSNYPNQGQIRIRSGWEQTEPTEYVAFAKDGVSFPDHIIEDRDW